MKFPPAQPLKALDLSGLHRVSPRKLESGDLDPVARLAKPGAASTQHDKLVKQTQSWVSQTFFGTLLKQMENSPFKSEMLSGGRGGEAFSSLYHQRLAEHMAKGAGGKLVNSIVRRIEAKAAYQKQQMPPANAATVPPAPAASEGRSPDARSGSNNGFGGLNKGSKNGSNNGRRHVHVAAAPRA
jgi:Rod binding domain-containing protein